LKSLDFFVFSCFQGFYYEGGETYVKKVLDESEFFRNMKEERKHEWFSRLKELTGKEYFLRTAISSEARKGTQTSETTSIKHSKGVENGEIEQACNDGSKNCIVIQAFEVEDIFRRALLEHDVGRFDPNLGNCSHLIDYVVPVIGDSYESMETRISRFSNLVTLFFNQLYCGSQLNIVRLRGHGYRLAEKFFHTMKYSDLNFGRWVAVLVEKIVLEAVTDEEQVFFFFFFFSLKIIGYLLQYGVDPPSKLSHNVYVSLSVCMSLSVCVSQCVCLCLTLTVSLFMCLLVCLSLNVFVSVSVSVSISV